VNVQPITYATKKLPNAGVYKITLRYTGREWAFNWHERPGITGCTRPPTMRAVLGTVALRTATAGLGYAEWLAESELLDNDGARSLYKREQERAIMARILFGDETRELARRYGDA
jgi:hypothetical protein